MSTLKAQLISERMKAEEELAQMRQKMKADQVIATDYIDLDIQP